MNKENLTKAVSFAFFVYVAIWGLKFLQGKQLTQELKDDLSRVEIQKLKNKDLSRSPASWTRRKEQKNDPPSRFEVVQRNTTPDNSQDAAYPDDIGLIQESGEDSQADYSHDEVRNKSFEKNRSIAIDHSHFSPPPLANSLPESPTSTYIDIPFSGLKNNNQVDPSAVTGPKKESSSSKAQGAFLESLNCSSNVGAGTFTTPVEISLSCSTISMIRYCIQEGNCDSPCSPLIGSVYSEAIILGEEIKNYCLSFIGLTAYGETSSVQNLSLSFIKGPPSLEVSLHKSFYQTTQLQALISLSSQDLPGESLGFGVMNLAHQNPSSFTCSQIVEDPTLFTDPAPMNILPLTDVNHFSSEDQLNIYLGREGLVYGENWILAYHQGANSESSYSCESRKIVLEDFPFFVANAASNSILNPDDVMELEGSFTSIGPFEKLDLYRAPAGFSMEIQNEQELRNGLFGVLY